MTPPKDIRSTPHQQGDVVRKGGNDKRRKIIGAYQRLREEEEGYEGLYEDL